MKPGDTLDGRYTITERLGAGGMGEVYKATHTFLGSSRVIKVVHPHISGNTDAKDRFDDVPEERGRVDSRPCVETDS